MVALAQALLATLAGGLTVLGGLWLSERAGTRHADRLRAGLFLAPAAVLLGLYLIYPVLGSFWRSLHDRGGDGFVGLGNYRALAADSGFQQAALNSLLWVLIVPVVTTCLGLAIAQMTDRQRWGGIARAAIFLPMAISSVGAALIWKLVYANSAETGLLNAVLGALGIAGPRDVLQIPLWNNLWLMLILIWGQTGFAMMILAAALRRIPPAMIEAAILDGAGPVQRFFRILLPQIRGAVLMVWAALSVLTLKTFDIVYTVTGGNFGTQILPGYLFALIYRDDGRATAAAMVLVAMVLPALIWHAARARRDGGGQG